MNAFTKAFEFAAPLYPSRVAHRRARGLGRETFTTHMEIEMTGDPRCGASVHCEIEVFEECPALPGCGDEPDEPAQYAIASIRPFEYRVLPTGFLGTERHYLPCPEWLEDRLYDCIDTDKLADAVRPV